LWSALASSRGRLLLVAVLSTFSVARQVDCMAADTSSIGVPLTVEIANSAGVSRYGVMPPDGPVQLLNAKTSSNGGDSLVRVVARIQEKRRILESTAASVRGATSRPIGWAAFSPDHKLVLAGPENPTLSEITFATVYRASDFSPILSIEGNRRIRDLRWSDDSKALMILESTDRMKKTPWGLLAAVSGHPIELQTYVLLTVNIATQRQSQLQIIEDVTNSDGEFST
jgi:hypothetical protein